MKIYVFNESERNFLVIMHKEKITLNINLPFSAGDMLLFLQENQIMGLSTIQSVQFLDEETDIHLTFDYAFTSDNRTSIYDPLMGNAFANLKSSNEVYLDSPESNFVLNKISSLENNLGFFLINMEHLMEEAEEMNDIAEKKEKRRENQLSFSKLNENFANEHLKAQYLLNEIGNICGVQTWTASNDKNRMFYQRKLGEIDIESFPLLNIPKESQVRIELIDNVWIKGNRPVCAFEVESTTPIYSGLLRLLDLATVLSTSNLRLYIVAPKSRIKKFLIEINRPVFQRLKMDQYCHFISIESLEILYQKIKGLDGYVDYNVLEIVQQSAKQLEKIQ